MEDWEFRSAHHITTNYGTSRMGEVGLGSPSWLQCLQDAAADQEGLEQMV